jgi:hypothetical protein
MDVFPVMLRFQISLGANVRWKTGERGHTHIFSLEVDTMYCERLE